MELQKEVQKAVLDYLRGTDYSQRTTSALEPEARDKVIALGEQGTALILVDIPTSRPGSSIPLEYLPEQERREMIEEWKEPKPLEDSVVWTQLHDSFMESVGKVRVFCHPHVRATLEAAVPKLALEQIVESHVKQLRSGVSSKTP